MCQQTYRAMEQLYGSIARLRQHPATASPAQTPSHHHNTSHQQRGDNDSDNELLLQDQAMSLEADERGTKPWVGSKNCASSGGSGGDDERLDAGGWLLSRYEEEKGAYSSPILGTEAKSMMKKGRHISRR
jgi:hypothetical protein